MKAKEEMENSFPNLRTAVQELYYAAVWAPDRDVDAAALWTAVRDAAGFRPGNSPTPIPFDGVRIEYSSNRLRLIGKLVRKAKGQEFTSDQVRAFLLLHGTELQDKMDKTVRDFLQEKLA